jgi:hypothetical protein
MGDRLYLTTPNLRVNMEKLMERRARLIGRGLGLMLVPGPGAWQSTWVIVEKCY